MLPSPAPSPRHVPIPYESGTPAAREEARAAAAPLHGFLGQMTHAPCPRDMDGCAAALTDKVIPKLTKSEVNI
jgi:hypothetical protein